MRASRMLHLLIMKTPLAHTSLKKLQAIIFVSAAVTIFQVAALRAELKLYPGSEVTTTSLAKLSCRAAGDSNGKKLISVELTLGRSWFLGTRHTARLAKGWLKYEGVRKQLLPGSCLYFHNPNVTFCAAERQLSVQFFVTTELAGKVVCGVFSSKSSPQEGKIAEDYATKHLQITNGIITGKSKAGLDILPESEVLTNTLVSLYCWYRYYGVYGDITELKFGAGKYTAQLSNSWLTYPEHGGSQRLPLGSCLDFSNPNLKFCHEKSKLLVQFNATQGLAGEVSCKVYSSKVYENPGFLDESDQDSHRDRFQTSGSGALVKKNLQITDILFGIIPSEPRAGEEVTVTCTFAAPAGDQPKRRMTGLKDWTQLSDRKSKVGGFTVLTESVVRNVTKMDNGRKVTCSSGGTKKSKTIFIRYPPYIKMQPNDGETVFPGDPITCSASANPPMKEIFLIRIRRSSGEWDFTRTSVTRTEFNIPIGTKVGDLKMICSARNALYSTTGTFTYKVQK